MSTESITFRYVKKNNFQNAKLKMFLYDLNAHLLNVNSHAFQNVDSALAESASIGPGGALGKLPR